MNIAQNQLDRDIAAFFDADILIAIRNGVMAASAPPPPRDPLLWGSQDHGINFHPYVQVRMCMGAFMREHGLLPQTPETLRVYSALEDRAEDLEDQIRAILKAGTFNTFLWATDAHRIWTVDIKHYALLRHVIDGIDIYFILHLPEKTIVYIDTVPMIDYAILKLLRADVPVYTEFPWLTYNLEQPYGQLV